MCTKRVLIEKAYATISYLYNVSYRIGEAAKGRTIFTTNRKWAPGTPTDTLFYL